MEQQPMVTGVGVLDKTVLVLRAVEAGATSLGELQASTGLPRATAHRLASALVAHGLLRRVDGGGFDLGGGLVGLGRAAAERLPLAADARASLTELRDATGEGVQLFVRDGEQRRCVVSIPSTHALRWIVPDGAVLPLDVGSAGHVLRGRTPDVGWIQSVAEREAGVASVSAPVEVAGEVVAAVCVSGPIERLGERPGERLGPLVVDAARRIAGR